MYNCYTLFRRDLPELEQAPSLHPVFHICLKDLETFSISLLYLLFELKIYLSVFIILNTTAKIHHYGCSRVAKLVRKIKFQKYLEVVIFSLVNIKLFFYNMKIINIKYPLTYFNNFKISDFLFP